MKAVILVVALLVAQQAQAQTSGSEPILLLVLGPPALFSIALDVMLLSTLVTDGTAGRGKAITAVVFASIGLVFSAITLTAGLGSAFTSPIWTGVSAATLGLEVGTMVVAIYGLVRGEPEDYLPPQPDRTRPERLYRPPPRPAEPPPQLFVPPFSLPL